MNRLNIIFDKKYNIKKNEQKNKNLLTENTNMDVKNKNFLNIAISKIYSNYIRDI